MHLDTLLLFSGGKADPNADSKTVLSAEAAKWSSGKM